MMANPLKHLDRYRDLVPDFAAFQEALEQPAPPHVRVNTLKSDAAAVTAALASLGVDARSEPWCSLMLRLDVPSERRMGTSLLHALGHVYIQSGSSAVAALALDASPGQRVLDLCAAPGSKTSFLAQRMENRGFLVANEVSRKRLTPLQANLRRMGVVNCILTSYSGQNFPLRARFDRVLVDAPCSGEGTWRGPHERAVPITRDARARLAERQAALLERGISVLAPGGELVYSTCTYAPEENELVVGPLMERYGLETLPLGLDIGALPGLTSWEGRRLPDGLARAVRLYPHRFDSEGFFVVRLAKRER